MRINQRVEALTRAVFSELDISHPSEPTVAALGQVIERHLAHPGVPPEALPGDPYRSERSRARGCWLAEKLRDELRTANAGWDAARRMWDDTAARCATAEAEAVQLRGLIRVIDSFVAEDVKAHAGGEAHRQWREAADR